MTLPTSCHAARFCNSRKKAKTVEEFRGYLQEKTKHQFWFEHAQVVVPVMVEEFQEDEEGASWPNQYEYPEYIWACIRVGQESSPGYALTLLHLFQASLDNFECTNEETSGAWFFHLSELAAETHQPIEHVCGHVMTLHSQGILQIAWQQGPQRSHAYTFRIDTLIHIDRELARQRQKRKLQKLTMEVAED